MKTRFIYNLISLLLLSLTVHQVHAATSHDSDHCEVCIHIHSNDDTTGPNNSEYALLDVATPLKTKTRINCLKPVVKTTVEFIRGPPTYL